jgi:hypothetical protein
MKRIPLFYIAGPFRAKSSWKIEQNIRRAEELALKVWEAGAACICPHTNTRFFQGEADDSVWLDGDMEILRRCDAVLLAPGWQESKGALKEKDEAERLAIPVFETIFEARVWIAARLSVLDGEERAIQTFIETVENRWPRPLDPNSSVNDDCPF